jgi:hypothetical protein
MPVVTRQHGPHIGMHIQVQAYGDGPWWRQSAHIAALRQLDDAEAQDPIQPAQVRHVQARGS